MGTVGGALKNKRLATLAVKHPPQRLDTTQLNKLHNRKWQLKSGFVRSGIKSIASLV